MTLQDQLRAEQTEVADTGALLLQAADELDDLLARVNELEAALMTIRDVAAAAL